MYGTNIQTRNHFNSKSEKILATEEEILISVQLAVVGRKYTGTPSLVSGIAGWRLICEVTHPWQWGKTDKRQYWWRVGKSRKVQKKNSERLLSHQIHQPLESAILEKLNVWGHVSVTKFPLCRSLHVVHSLIRNLSITCQKSPYPPRSNAWCCGWPDV